MRTEIIKIGNSRGLRIPKSVLEHCGMERVITLRIEDQRIILTPYKEPRTGWEEKFQLMAQNKDDTLLDSDSPSWDEEEWQW